MTFYEAKKLLPKWAKGLAEHAVTVVALRDAVMQEIEAYNAGNNPMTFKQKDALLKFLDRTA